MKYSFLQTKKYQNRPSIISRCHRKERKYQPIERSPILLALELEWRYLGFPEVEFECPKSLHRHAEWLKRMTGVAGQLLARYHRQAEVDYRRQSIQHSS